MVSPFKIMVSSENRPRWLFRRKADTFSCHGINERFVQNKFILTIQRMDPLGCSTCWEPLHRDFTVAKPKSPILTVQPSWIKISGRGAEKMLQTSGGHDHVNYQKNNRKLRETERQQKTELELRSSFHIVAWSWTYTDQKTVTFYRQTTVKAKTGQGKGYCLILDLDEWYSLHGDNCKGGKE